MRFPYSALLRVTGRVRFKPTIVIPTLSVDAGVRTIEYGGTLQLTATASDGAAAEWSSSNVDVATVDVHGLVTWVSEGTVVITATHPDYPLVSDSVTVTTEAEPVAETGTVGFQVPNKNSPSSGELEVTALFESWGYTVVYVDDSDGTSAATGLDMLYVHGSTSGGSDSSWADKWRNLSIPVVCAKPQALDDYRMAEGRETNDAKVAVRNIVEHPASTQSTGSFNISNSVGTMWYATDLPEHATILVHRVGEPRQAVAFVMERGDTRTDATTCPARRAWMWPGGINIAAQSTEGKKLAREIFAWCLADSADRTIARFTFLRDWEPDDASSISVTDESTMASGASSLTYAWRLLDSSLTVVDTSTAAEPTFSGLADGDYVIELTVTDDLGGTSTRRYLTDLTLQAPTSDFDIVVDTEAADNNTITINSAASDPDGTIVTYETSLYNSAGAQVGSTETGSSVQFTGLADDTYRVVHRVVDDDDAEDTSEQEIILPRPLASASAEVIAVGLEAYGYNYSEALSGATITSTAWDFDTNRPGTYTGTGLHPKVAIDAAGTYDWRCEITQSNGSVTVITGTWDAWAVTDYDGAQDYTRPSYTQPGDSTTWYFDADIGDDANDGLAELTPKKTLVELKRVLEAGDTAYLRGDFKSQDASIEPPNGSATHWTVIAQWPGSASKPSIAGKYSGNYPAVWAVGRSYVVLEGLDIDGRWPKEQGLASGTHAMICSNGAHDVQIVDCDVRAARNGLHLTQVSDVWIDGCSLDECGNDVTSQAGNTGECIIMFACEDVTIVRSYIGRAGHAAVTVGVYGSFPGPNWRVRIAQCEIENIWAGSIGVAGAYNCLFEDLTINRIGDSTNKGNVGSKVGINIRGILNRFRRIRISNVEREGIKFQTNDFIRRQHSIGNHVHDVTVYNCKGKPLSFYLYGSGVHMEDNLVENVNAYENHHPNWEGEIPGWWSNKYHAIWYSLWSGDEWIVQNIWDAWGQAPANLAGNYVRNCNFYQTKHANPGAYALVLHVKKSTDLSRSNVRNQDAAAFELAYPDCADNLEVDPLVASTNIEDADYLELTASSPLIDAGYPVSGESYLGTAPDIGWKEKA